MEQKDRGKKDRRTQNRKTDRQTEDSMDRQTREGQTESRQKIQTDKKDSKAKNGRHTKQLDNQQQVSMEENYCGHLQNNRAFTEENNDHTYCTVQVIFVTIMYISVTKICQKM